MVNSPVLMASLDRFLLQAYYRPQRSCGKVMFLCLSVILSMGGVCPSACWDTHSLGIHPPGRHPPRQTPPLPSAFWDTHPMPSACWDTHLPAQCMLGYTWLLLRTVRILLECILVWVTLTLNPHSMAMWPIVWPADAHIRVCCEPMALPRDTSILYLYIYLDRFSPFISGRI